MVSCDESYVTPAEWTYAASLVYTRVTHITTEWKTIGTNRKLSKDRKYIFIFSISVLTYVWIEIDTLIILAHKLNTVTPVLAIQNRRIFYVYYVST